MIKFISKPRQSEYNKKDLKRGVDHIGCCVVFFCHDGKGNILMNKRSDKCRDEVGTWDCESGSMEFGETFEEAVQREIMEEYCIEAHDINFAGVSNVLRKNVDTNTHWIAFLFSAVIDPDKAKIGDPEKMDDIRWFPFDNLPSPLHSKFLDHFKMVKKSGTVPHLK